jgi:molybdopterin-guanine dinucleotide biosynthesis protein A
MSSEPPILGLILAGGRAERFGGAPKGLAQLRGTPLITYVANSLKLQAARIGISVSALNAGDYASLGHPLILDYAESAGRGPLSGLLAGLDWAADHNAKALLIAPCDAPFLAGDLWRDLVKTLASSGADAVISATAHEAHPLCAALRPSLAPALKAHLADPGARLAVRAFLDTIRVETILLPDEAQFTNVNSKEDLARAEAAFDSRLRRP